MTWPVGVWYDEANEQWWWQPDGVDPIPEDVWTPLPKDLAAATMAELPNIFGRWDVFSSWFELRECHPWRHNGEIPDQYSLTHGYAISSSDVDNIVGTINGTSPNSTPPDPQDIVLIDTIPMSDLAHKPYSDEIGWYPGGYEARIAGNYFVYATNKHTNDFIPQLWGVWKRSNTTTLSPTNFLFKTAFRVPCVKIQAIYKRGPSPGTGDDKWEAQVTFDNLFPSAWIESNQSRYSWDGQLFWMVNNQNGTYDFSRLKYWPTPDIADDIYSWGDPRLPGNAYFGDIQNNPGFMTGWLMPGGAIQPVDVFSVWASDLTYRGDFIDRWVQNFDQPELRRASKYVDQHGRVLYSLWDQGTRVGLSTLLGDHGRGPVGDVFGVGELTTTSATVEVRHLEAW